MVKLVIVRVSVLLWSKQSWPYFLHSFISIAKAKLIHRCLYVDVCFCHSLLFGCCFTKAGDMLLFVS